MLQAWGKTDKERGEFHTLAHHSIDVEAVFARMLQLPVIRDRLEAAGRLGSCRGRIRGVQSSNTPPTGGVRGDECCNTAPFLPPHRNTKTMGRTRMLRLPALCAVLLGVLATHEARAHGEQESCPAGWTASQCAVMHRHAHRQSCPQGWSEATCRGYVARHEGGTSTGTITTTRRLTAREHLRTKRFRTHQPKVLEQIGAHHAYAKGLTGRGVRIGIEDSVVDYTQRNEFGNRVKTQGNRI